MAPSAGSAACARLADSRLRSPTEATGSTLSLRRASGWSLQGGRGGERQRWRRGPTLGPSTRPLAGGQLARDGLGSRFFGSTIVHSPLPLGSRRAVYSTR